MPWTKFDDIFNLKLEQALDAWDPPNAKNGYGKGRWEKIRGAHVPASLPHAGEFALDAIAISLVNDEANPITSPFLVYPHPAGSQSHSGGFLHVTDGLPGNIALDFMAPGGTALLSPFPGQITRLSGRSPSLGVRDGDKFGWSIYVEREDGLFAFMTHLGSRVVSLGQHVAAGQKIGSVGSWPHDPGRSHTHLGITSPRGVKDATHILLSIATAPRIVAV